MVRAVAVLASTVATVASVEQTGLLQATVGIHNQLASGKAASIQKLEKEWEAKAMAMQSADPLSQHDNGDEVGSSSEIFSNIIGTMDTILDECNATKISEEGLLSGFLQEMVNVEASMDAFFAADGAGFSTVEDLREAHEACRDATQQYCDDMTDDCNAKVNLSKSIISDDSDSGHTLCGCSSSNNQWKTNKMLNCQAHAGDWAGESQLSSLIDAINECNASDTALTNQAGACATAQTSFEESIPEYKMRHESACAEHQTNYTSFNTSFEAAWMVVDGPGGSEEATQAICYSAMKVKKWVDVIQSCTNGPCDGEKEAAIAYDPTDYCRAYTINKPGPAVVMQDCPAIPSPYPSWPTSLPIYPFQVCTKVTVLEQTMSDISTTCSTCFD